MFKTKNTYLSILMLFVVLISCGKSEDEEVETISLSINCPNNITITLNTSVNGAVVNYNLPESTNNATISQTAGLASGEIFPRGTTTNTFKATDATGATTSCSFDVTIISEPGSNPFFVGNNPVPSGKKWVKIDDLSDEFNDNSFDNTKWKNTDPDLWVGRPPGLFKENAVTETDGNLRLTAYKLDNPETVRGNEYTHAGASIYSRKTANVGTYLECRMKANKTFMSSTFWFINVRSEGSGCDKRVAELDIQECVGQITGTINQDFDESIHSNSHSRSASCSSTVEGSAGKNAKLSGKAWADYYVYGAWWKSPTEVIFYLNGEEIYTINPVENFNLPSYLRLVVETYDWNPVPADGGMTGSFNERTTYYDWVRTWELKDE